MARWKKLWLASALLAWPAVCGAQSMGGSMSAPVANSRPGLFDTSSSRGTAVSSAMPMKVVSSPATSAPMASDSAVVSAGPNVSGMPVSEGVMPASCLSGCNSGCNSACDYGNTWGVTSMATDGPCGWVAMGELLWLKMRRNDPVVLETFVDGAFTNGSLHDYETDYSLGFRVGGGYLARSGWLFTAMYTRYKDDSKVQTFEADSPDGSHTILYVGPGVFASDIQFSEGVLQTKWEFDYQTIDLMLGAVVSPSSCLDLIVQGGVRLGNLQQTYYTAAALNPEVPTFLGEQLDLEIRGAGPRVGTEARLYLAKCVQLYGRSYASLLLANRQENSNSFVEDFGGTDFRNYTYTREEILPMFELAAGVECAFLEGQFLVGFGYEWNFLLEAGSTNVDFASNARFNRHVNLTLDGFALKCSFLW